MSDNCIFNRRPNGTLYAINEVGEDSKFFDKIIKQPFIKTEEQAKDIYLNIFSRRFKNESESTQEFFSTVTNKKDDKFVPKNTYQYDYDFNESQQVFKTNYEKRLNNFDLHIAASIPTFRDIQIKKGQAIIEMFAQTNPIINEDLNRIKEKYLAKANLPDLPRKKLVLNPDLFNEIADFHKNQEDDRNNPEMIESYEAFLEETKQQFELLQKEGYVLEPYLGEGEPYGVYSKKVRKDLKENKHLFYLRSSVATGDNNTNDTAENYIPFRDSGITINGEKVLLNDLFRAVHDVFGHGMVNNSFSSQGELNAYTTHAPMYSKKAQKALFLETVVYNAWYWKNKSYAPRKIYNIPQELIDRTLNSVATDALVYDLGGSEGSLVKTITELSNSTIKTINLEPNKDMVAKHNTNPVEGSEIITEAFLEGFDEFEKHVPQQKADVVNETMLFQFIKQDRFTLVQEVIDNYLKEDGLFLTEEKFRMTDPKEQKLNEEFKNKNHKSKYFTSSELKTKEEVVLTGMEEKQALVDNYIRLLKNKFKFVEVYWKSGNFLGIAASNDKNKIDKFLSSLGNTNSIYSKKIEIKPKGYSAKLQLLEHNKRGGEGSSFLANGEEITQKAVVSVFPNRTKILSKQLEESDLETFFEENKDIIKGRENVIGIGTWLNKKSGDTYLDLIINVPLSQAIRLGQELGELAIFDVKSNSLIETGTEGVLRELKTINDTLQTIEKINRENLDPESDIGIVFGIGGDRIVSSYQQALTEVEEGNNIDVIIIKEGTPFTIATITKNTNLTTVDGFINAHIESGIIAEEKEPTNKGLKFKVGGWNETQQHHSKIILQDTASAHLGTNSLKFDGNTFDIQKTTDTVTILNKKGELKTESKEKLQTKNIQELRAETETPVEIITEREFTDNIPPYRDIKFEEEKPTTLTKEQLQFKLLRLLEKMGVSVTSISEYMRKYKIKNGVNPDAKALADIANMVVALQDSGDIESLSEELGHFIVEATPEEQLSNILRNIHKTEEWSEFSDYYRKIYAEEGLIGEELEAVVRKEILGKIISKSLLKLTDSAKTETQKNIFERVAEIISKFIESIKANFTDSFRTELDQYLSEIENMVLTEQLGQEISLSQLKENKFRFYNAKQKTSNAAKIGLKAELLLEELQDIEKTLIKGGAGSRSKSGELARIQDSIKRGLQISSLASLISMVNANTKQLEASLEDSKKNNKPFTFSSEENIVFQHLKNIIGKTLDEIKVLLTDEAQETGTKDFNPLIKELEITSTNIRDIIAKAEVIDTKNVENLIKKIKETHNLQDSEIELIEKWLNFAKSDTNLFHTTFGQLVHAKDGLLNLTHHVLKNMRNEAHAKFFDSYRNFINTLTENGVKPQDLKQFVDGGFILDEIDWNEFTKKTDIAFAESYKKALKETLEKFPHEIENGAEIIYKDFINSTNEEIIKLRDKKELKELSLREEVTRKNNERELLKQFIERPMKDSFYDNLNKKYKEAGLANITIQELSNISADMAILRSKALRREGDRVVMDFTSLSEQDLNTLKQVARRRKMLKSFVMENGELKPGLEFKMENGKILQDEEGNPLVILANPQQATDETIIALDLHNLDSIKTPEEKKQDASLFWETLRKVDKQEGRERAIKFLKSNAFIRFSKDFWDGLKGNKSLLDKLQDSIDRATTREFRDKAIALKSELQTNTFKLRSILKTFGDRSNPSEINVDLMSSTAKDSVKKLQQEIKDTISKISDILDLGNESNEEKTIRGISEANNSYLNELRYLKILENQSDSEQQDSEKLEEELRFAQEHILPEDFLRILQSFQNIDKFIKGERESVNRTIQRVLDDLEIDTEDLKNVQIRNEVKRIILRKNLLPYYKRFSPEGYSTFEKGLETASDLVSYLQNDIRTKSAFIEVEPNNTFYDFKENSEINENFDKDFKGGFLQPKKNLFKNQKFKNLFGEITTVNGVKTAEKNNKLFLAYQSMLKFNEEGLSAMGVSEQHNKFILPQVRKQKIQRLVDTFSGKSVENVRNAVLDFFNFTEDDLVLGETKFGKDIKVIPRLYLNKLENPEDVSNDLFFSLALRAREGFLREARVKAYGDIMSIQDKILSREMFGKPAQSSNTYKMFKSAVDFNLFGIKETVTLPINTAIGTFDLAKIGRQFLNFIKFRNLGLNVVIPITSLITGEITRKIESIVGEILDIRSQKLGVKEFNKLSMDAMKEAGEINQKSRLVLLGQFFRAFDPQESFENSNYGKLLRFMPRLGMFLHGASNFSIYSKALLGTLHDFRIIDGAVTNRSKYLKEAALRNVSKKEALAEWNKNENEVIYKYLITKNDKIEFDKVGLSKVLLKNGKQLTDAELDAEIENIFNVIQRKVQFVNSVIDGQLPEEERVLAQRHFILSYFMTHRGWLTINIARRFKDRHLNLDTQLIEEGSYRSLWNYLGRFLKGVNKEGIAKTVEVFSQAWDAADEVERRNIKRVGIEVSALSVLMVLALVLRGFAEDDDNEDVFTLQLANYLTYRTINELSSVQFNIVSNFSETIDSPIVGWQTMTNLVDIGDIFSSAEVKNGVYKGLSERQRFLTKMIPGLKQIYDLNNMNQTFKTYKFFNKRNLTLTPLEVLGLNKTAKDREKERKKAIKINKKQG